MTLARQRISTVMAVSIILLVQQGTYAYAQKAKATDAKGVTQTYALERNASRAFDAGQMDTAIGLYQSALQGFRRIRPVGHTEIEVTASNLVQALRETGRQREAEILIREVISIRSAGRPARPTSLANAYDILGEILSAQGRAREALPFHDQALTLRTAHLPSGDIGFTFTWIATANTLQQLGRLTDAEILLRRSAAVKSAVNGPDHPDTQTVMNNLANLLSEMGRGGEALAVSRQVLASRQRTLPPNHPRLINTLVSVGHFETQVGIPEQGVANLDAALRQMRLSTQANSPATAHALGLLAGAMISANRPLEASTYSAQALAIARETLGPNDLRLAEALLQHAIALSYHDQSEEALSLSNAALAINGAVQDGFSNHKTRVRLSRAVLLRNLRRLPEAYAEYRLAGRELLDGPGTNAGIDLQARAEFDSWRHLFVRQFQSGWATAHDTP